MLKSNNPNLKSWVEVQEGSDFSIQNLPFGIFSNGGNKKVGVALGTKVIDLKNLSYLGYLKDTGISNSVFESEFLNDFMVTGKSGTRAVRERISELFSTDNNELKNNSDHVSKILINENEVEMHLPIKVGDYTDFYSSKEHATNVGTMFRDPDNALLPNWLYIPVGYHGRASSIIPSGQPIYRPKGQHYMHTR